MKVKVLKRFRDKYTGEIYEADKEMSISKGRFEEILTIDKFVEEVVEQPVEEIEKPTPKKKRTKKTDE